MIRILSEEEKNAPLRENKMVYHRYQDLMYLKEFVNLMKTKREDGNISQKKLATCIGTKQPAIARLESCSQFPSFTTYLRICRELSINKYDLPEIIPNEIVEVSFSFHDAEIEKDVAVPVFISGSRNLSTNF